MSQDPYPHERPRPRDDEPYSHDPYVARPAPGQDSAGSPPTLPLEQSQPGQVGPPGAPGVGAPGHIPPPSPPPTGMAPAAPLPAPYSYPYPPAQPAPVSAIVLTVLSGLMIFTVYGCVIGIAPLIFGILGITQNSTDPAGARRMTNIGWAIFAGLLLLVVITIVVILAIVFAGSA